MRSAEAERKRLLIAMTQVVGRRGYRAASVAEVIAEAESCRVTFDRHFADKEECFCAAHERVVELALGAVGERIDPELPWAERAKEALRMVLELCRRRPGLARAVIVEPAAAGAVGRRRELEAARRFAELIALDGELVGQVSPRATLMATSGVAALIGDQLQRDAAGLSELAPELTFALLMPVLGPVAAREQIAPVAERAEG
jgi:AcrR family transcriptional regulator